MASIDTARFLRDLNGLRLIGADRMGAHRPMGRMTELGLAPEIAVLADAAEPILHGK